jgi:TPP-dependent 2-oxoacid decarboxylase
MGKSIINETNIAAPNYLGIYAADYSTEGIVALVQSADCILSIGTVDTDLNSGGFTEDGIDYSRVIAIKPESIKIGKQLYADISVEMLLEYLIEHMESDPAHQLSFERPAHVCLPQEKLAGEKLTHEAFWPLVAEHIVGEGDIVVAEAGSSLFGLLHQDLPAEIDFVSQILWASIGYTLPAAIGSAIASPDRRVLLFIGDGSFQLTAQEVSLIAKYDLNITIFLINNDGYTIERAIHGPTQSYNDIYMWKYLDLANSLGIQKTITVKDFDAFFGQIEEMQTAEPKMVELFFDKLDYPPLLKQISDKLEEANRQE